MKKILFTFILGMLVLSAFSQEKTLFLDNEPWEKVLKEAQKSKKMVFVDTYTQWCGPCKDLMNKILPQKEVSDYLRANFICVKYDLEGDNGKEFNSRYRDWTIGVPTMFITDAQGNLLHIIKGAGREGETLVNFIKEGLSGKSLYEVEKEYQQGNRDRNLIKRYLWFLWDGVNNVLAYEKVAGDYIAQFPIDSLLSLDIWRMAEKFIWKDPYSQEYRFIIEHLDEIGQMADNYYSLENTLCHKLRYETNVVNWEITKTENTDSLAVLKQKVDRLLELSKNPVRGFPQIMADLLVVKSMLDQDVDKVYEYFMAFEDCNFLLDVAWYRKPVFKYLLAQLDDEQRLQACMERLFAYQNRLNGSEKSTLDDVIALGKEKLATNFGYDTAALAQKNDKEKPLWAKSVLGKKAPELTVEEWVSKKPELKGKFVLVNFWVTCGGAIPELNEISKQFKDDVVVVFLSEEPADAVKALMDPKAEYYTAVDTKRTMMKALEVQAVPHVIFIDPEGIVRWEGCPFQGGYELTSEVVKNLIEKYKK